MVPRPFFRPFFHSFLIAGLVCFWTIAWSKPPPWTTKPGTMRCTTVPS